MEASPHPARNQAEIRPGNLSFYFGLKRNYLSAIFPSFVIEVLWPRPGNGHDMALELVSGANCRCVLYHSSSLTRLNGSRG